MNTMQIDEIFKKYSYTRKIYKGTRAFDELPKKIKRPSAYIINTETRDKDGEHWIAIYYNNYGNVEFFDSFGLGPAFYGLEDFLLKTSNKCFYNTFALQSLNSEYCGYYCVLFVLFKCKKKSFLNFLNHFDQDTFINDKNIKKLIEQFY
jgi:hypothetical protein